MRQAAVAMHWVDRLGEISLIARLLEAMDLNV